VIDLDSLAPDWAWSDWAWSIGTPVEKRVYYYCPGVTVAVTIEGDTVTASPARAIAPSEQPGNPASPPESPSRSLFTIRTVPKPKLVL
jgi:hypothetical protein